MAKKIRFPLIMTKDIAVRSLDELREHFNLEAVLEYYENGKLLTWLEDRYLDEVAETVRSLDKNMTDFQRQLCKAFNVEYTGDAVDLEEIRHRQERLAYLRTITDEDEYLNNIDHVAFNQKELTDLLDAGETTIYLCGKKFTVPTSPKGITYIGIGEPKVVISGIIPENFDEIGISFISCKVKKGGTVLILSSLWRSDDWKKWKNIVSLTCDCTYGNRFVIGVKLNGDTVVLERNIHSSFICLSPVKYWRNISSLACGPSHVVGLRKDGTVVAHSYGESLKALKQCHIEDWCDIVEIACGDNHTVGLRRDGTVVATGENTFQQCDVECWKEISSIFCNGNYTIGVKKDGTVVATGFHFSEVILQWEDIALVAGTDKFVIGLKKDGTTVAATVGTGYDFVRNKFFRCREIEVWKDIVSISVGRSFVAGLKRDRTVVIAGDGVDSLKDEVQTWRNIISIACGGDSIAGVVASNDYAI